MSAFILDQIAWIVFIPNDMFANKQITTFFDEIFLKQRTFSWIIAQRKESVNRYSLCDKQTNPSRATHTSEYPSISYKDIHPFRKVYDANENTNINKSAACAGISNLNYCLRIFCHSLNVSQCH